MSFTTEREKGCQQTYAAQGPICLTGCIVWLDGKSTVDFAFSEAGYWIGQRLNGIFHLPFLSPMKPTSARPRPERSTSTSAKRKPVTAPLAAERDEIARLEAEVETLAEREEFYRSIVQSAEEGIWRINAKSLTEFVNPKMAEMLGYTAAEMVGRPVSDFLDSARQADLEGHLNRRRNGVAEQFEFQYLRKDGSTLWAFVSSNPLVNAKGEYLGAVALMTDIGDRKSMEQQLAHTADLLARTGQMAKVGGWELDLRCGQLFWSEETCRLFGVPADYQPTLERAILFYAPEDQLMIRQAVETATQHGTSYELELRIFTEDGQWIWTLSHGSAIWEGGKVVRLVGTVQDITERKEVELKYLRELDFNLTLVNHTAAIILLLDAEGRIVHVNEATTHLLGYQRSELIGQTFWGVGILQPKRESLLVARVRQLLAGDSSHSSETRLHTKQGRSLVFSLSSIATRLPDGSIDRIILTGTDLTERNRLQQELLNISEREQSRIGHNLHDGVGQTLTGVASLISALEVELSEPQSALAARIGHLVQEAIQEVRHLSHSMSPTAVKNRGLIGVLHLLADSLRQNHRISCDLELEAGFKIKHEDQENHLYRIAQEAASNAIRHGKASHIRISLSRSDECEGLLRIEDNGCGLPATNKRTSRGIGLQVMHYRANLIGGNLQIQPRTPSGVAVNCRFPCPAAPARRKANGKAKAKLPR